MMTHGKNEVSLATQIFRMAAGVDFLKNGVAAEFIHILSVTVNFFLASRLLYVQSLIINFAEITLVLFSISIIFCLQI